MSSPREVWLDMQLPPSLCARLSDTLGVPVRHFSTMAFDRTPDERVFAAAREAGVLIVSKDADFAELAHKFGGPPAVLWLRCGNASTESMADILLNAMPKAMELTAAGEPLIEVASRS